MRDLRDHYAHQSNDAAVAECTRVITNHRSRVLYQFKVRDGDPYAVPKSAADDTLAERSFRGLREMARRAEMAGNREAASQIRANLHQLGVSALAELRALCAEHPITQAPAAQSAPSTPETNEPAATAAAVPLPTDTFPEPGWFSAYKCLYPLAERMSEAGWYAAFLDFHSAHASITRSIRYRFNRLGGRKQNLEPLHAHPKPLQRWYAIEEMLNQARRSGDTKRIDRIREAKAELHQLASRRFRELAGNYGPVEYLASMSTDALRALRAAKHRATVPAIAAWQPLASNPGAAQMLTVRPQAPPWLHNVYAVERALIAGNPPAGFDASGAIPEPPRAALPTLQQLLSLPPGPSSRVMAGPTMPAPPSQTPLTTGMAQAASGSADTRFAQRMPIVRRFIDYDTVSNAEHLLQTGGAGALGWTAARCSQVLKDIARLHEAARSDAAAATTLDELDWNSIEDLARILYSPPSSS